MATVEKARAAKVALPMTREFLPANRLLCVYVTMIGKSTRFGSEWFSPVRLGSSIGRRLREEQHDAAQRRRLRFFVAWGGVAQVSSRLLGKMRAVGGGRAEGGAAVQRETRKVMGWEYVGYEGT